MENAGVALIASGASTYISDLKSAEKATSGFVDTTDKGSGIVGKAGKVMAGAIGDVAKIAAGVGVTAFVAFGKALYDGIGDAKEAALQLAQTNAVIKSTGGVAGVTTQQVLDLATAMSASQGQSLFGDDQIQASENMLLTFTEIGSDVFPAATQATLDMAQALHTTPEAMSMMIGKALNSAEGFTALKRSGVAFTDSQEEMIKQLFATGDAAGAQKIILAELGKEFGGQAAAAAAADGGWAQFNDRLGEAKESLGAAVLPLLSGLAGVLNDQVIPVVEDGAAAFGELVGALGPLSSYISAVVEDGDYLNDFLVDLPEPMQGVVQMVGEVISAFNSAGGASDTLGAVLVDLSDTFDNVLYTVQDVADGYMAIANAVLPIVTKLWDDHGAEISAFVKTTYDKIIQIVNLALQLYDSIVPPILQAVAGFISDHAEAIETILSGAWNVISGTITGVLALIEGAIKVALDVIHGDWSQAWTDVQAMSVTFTESIGTVITGFLDIIAGFFDTSLADILKTWQDNWNMLLDIAMKVGDQMLDAGEHIVAGIVQGIEDNASAIYDALKEIADKAVHAFLHAIGAESPATAFMPAGEYAVMGIMKGFQDMMPSLKDLVAGMGDDLISQVADIASAVQDAIGDAFGATASIDRQMASNLDKLSKMQDGFYKTATENALRSAAEQAKAFADPAVGAKYYQMRSKQIFEFQDLQQKIDAETDAEKKKSLQQQQILILKAQEAEQSAFDATNSRTSSSLGDLVKEIGQLFTNKNLLDLQKQLAEAKTDAERARITELIKQASVPVNDTGVGHDLMAMLRQLEIFLGLYTPPPGAAAGGGFAEKGQPYWVGEDGPELFWPGVNGTVMPAATSAQLAAQSRSTTYNGQVGNSYTMPIYTNQSPAVIQQSLAIAAATMP